MTVLLSGRNQLSEIQFKRKLEEKSQDTVIIPWDKEAALGFFVDRPPSIKYLPLMGYNQGSVVNWLTAASRKSVRKARIFFDKIPSESRNP